MKLNLVYVFVVATAGLGFFAQQLAAAEPAKTTDVAADDYSHLMSFRVQIIDHQGNPVAGAKVTPWALASDEGHGHWRTPDDNPADAPTVTTDANGMAEVPYPELEGELESSRVTAVSCNVSHDDIADTSYNNVTVPQVDIATIEVDPGGLVRLRGIIDGNLADSTDMYANWSTSTAAGYKIRRDDIGNVVLPRIPAGLERIRLVRLPKDGPAMFSEVLELEVTSGEEYPLLLDMRPGVSVKGELSDNVPRPVVNGRVVASVLSPRADDEEGWESLFWVNWATINPDGTFSLSDLPGGEHLQLIAICDGYVAVSGAPPEFALKREKEHPGGFQRPQTFLLSDEVNRITLAMEKAATFTAQIVDRDNEPIEGIRVTSNPNVGWWNGGSQLYCHPLYKTSDMLRNPGPFKRDPNWPFAERTNGEGEATLATLPAGRINISLFKGDDSLTAVGDERYYRYEIEPGETLRESIEIDRPAEEP